MTDELFHLDLISENFVLQRPLLVEAALYKEKEAATRWGFLISVF